MPPTWGWGACGTRTTMTTSTHQRPGPVRPAQEWLPSAPSALPLPQGSSALSTTPTLHPVLSTPCCAEVRTGGPPGQQGLTSPSADLGHGLAAPTDPSPPAAAEPRGVGGRS